MEGIASLFTRINTCKYSDNPELQDAYMCGRNDEMFATLWNSFISNFSTKISKEQIDMAFPHLIKAIQGIDRDSEIEELRKIINTQ